MEEKNKVKEDTKDMHIEMNNLAMPEVHFEKEIEAENESNSGNIDYSGAVPEIHIKK